MPVGGYLPLRGEKIVLFFEKTEKFTKKPFKKFGIYNII